MDRNELEILVNNGLSQRKIAEHFDKSQSSIRHWLKKYNLSTKGNHKPYNGTEPKYIDKICSVHGETSFVFRTNRYKCRKCESSSTHRRRIKVIQKLKERAGGCCTICGYNKYFGALEFHHLNPSEKLFNVNRGAPSWSYERYEREADKCVLLCSNCHKEVEAGITELSP